jgi:asparagine synthase (glutamine-hydrolysing)
VAYTPDDLVTALAPVDPKWDIEDFHRIWKAGGGARILDRLLLLNLRTYLVDDLLPKVDRMSMAHALEVRCPFLDHEFAEFALRLPPSTKVRGMSLKRCLKAAFQDVLPAEILARPKHGFGVPLDRWFRQDLAGYVTSQLGAADGRVRAHVSGGALDTILNEHRLERRNHGHVLWTLLTLEVFLRQRGW